MKVFVYEHITATMPASDSSLYREGRAMRDALTADLDSSDGIEVVSFREGDSFDECVRLCDAVWLVAPEFGDILGKLSDRVLELGKILLGPSPKAIRLTSDKLKLSAHWKRSGVPTPVTVICQEKPSFDFPYAVKPVDGCGSTATTLVRSDSEWEMACHRGIAEGYDRSKLIAQPFHPGQPASVAFLIGQSSITPLVPTFQQVSPESHFAYEGGELPIPAELAARAIRLGRRAVECVPGLFGFVGVDLIQGTASDGSQDMAIEINPRLTTSYVGLQALAEFNLANAVIELLVHNVTPAPRWKSGRMKFTPDGLVTEL